MAKVKVRVQNTPGFNELYVVEFPNYMAGSIADSLALAMGYQEHVMQEGVMVPNPTPKHLWIARKIVEMVFSMVWAVEKRGRVNVFDQSELDRPPNIVTTTN